MHLANAGAYARSIGAALQNSHPRPILSHGALFQRRPPIVHALTRPPRAFRHKAKGGEKSRGARGSCDEREQVAPELAGVKKI